MNCFILKKLTEKSPLSFFFLLTYLISTSSSQSYHTISIDAINDFNQTHEKFNTSTNIPDTIFHAYFTWDSQNLYLGYSGSKLISDPDNPGAIFQQQLWWYFDIDPQLNPKSGNGTDQAVVANFAIWPPWLYILNFKRWTLPFNADYAVLITYPGDAASTKTLMKYSASAQDWAEGQYLDAELSASSTTDGYIELCLPLNLIENPDDLYILGFLHSNENISEPYDIVYNEQGFPIFAERDLYGSYGSWPASSLEGGDGDKKENGKFNDWFGYTLIAGVNPNDPAYFDQPLYVSLTSFTAHRKYSNIELSWSTASEIENYRFILEKSTDSTVFQPIASIPGQGNSNVQTNYTYTDYDIAQDKTYFYRLIDEDFQGKRSYHQIITAKPLNIRLVDSFILKQNYPNPFNRETNIIFSVPVQNTPAIDIEIKIYNASGQEVTTLLKDNFEPGNYKIKWNGKDNSGKEMPTGVYFYRLISQEISQTAKMILLK